jgi:hypothetical protein
VYFQGMPCTHTCGRTTHTAQHAFNMVCVAGTSICVRCPEPGSTAGSTNTMCVGCPASTVVHKHQHSKRNIRVTSTLSICQLQLETGESLLAVPVPTQYAAAAAAADSSDAAATCTSAAAFNQPQVPVPWLLLVLVLLLLHMKHQLTWKPLGSPSMGARGPLPLPRPLPRVLRGRGAAAAPSSPSTNCFTSRSSLSSRTAMRRPPSSVPLRLFTAV